MNLRIQLPVDADRYRCLMINAGVSCSRTQMCPKMRPQSPILSVSHLQGPKDQRANLKSFKIKARMKKCIEDIYFFEVNTKYISSNMMKISVKPRVHSTSEISDIFNT